MSLHFDLSQASLLERSKQLTDVLRERILAQGEAISFAEYMEQVLYHPALGYYNRPDFTLGKKGDFITAPLISPLYARCFAQQCQQCLSVLGGGDILEIGAGTGHFAADLLSALQRLEALPAHYYIYEISPALRSQQQQFLQAACPLLYSRIVWLAALPAGFNGVVIANEVLDALPINCFTIIDGDIKERCVGIQDDQFVWVLLEPQSIAFREKSQALQFSYQFADNYASEIHLSMTAFITALTKGIHQGMLLFADYGYGSDEYYHPQRMQGTLTCFYQQHHHADPFIWPGLQDITAHVNFTDLIECAATHGCTLEGYTSQAAFLMNCGLINLAVDNQSLSPEALFQQQQAIKTLTLPTEMGERVKVMAIGKNLPADITWMGFQAHDRSRDLDRQAG